MQTNKARDAVRIADVIETLDRPKLADAIAAAIAKEGRTPSLLIEVNTGDESAEIRHRRATRPTASLTTARRGSGPPSGPDVRAAA